LIQDNIVTSSEFDHLLVFVEMKALATKMLISNKNIS